jgi:hypothetical protein
MATSSSAFHEYLFPDRGAASKPNSQQPSFDPDLFLLDSGQASEPEEVQLWRHGNTAQAQRLGWEKIGRMPLDEAISYAGNATNGIHELRHCHDLFGTTAGFSRIDVMVSEALTFHDLLLALRQHGRMRLPLARWSMYEDAPSELKEYMRNRREVVKNIACFDGNVPPVEQDGVSSAPDTFVDFRPAGVQMILPGLCVDLRDRETKREFHLVAPLGYQSIVEGNAIAIQHVLIEALYGREVASPWLAGIVPTAYDNYPLHYTAVGIYLHRLIAGQPPATLQTALSDVALMPEDQDPKKGAHPGFRFVRAARQPQIATLAKGLLSASQDVRAKDVMRLVAKEAGWKSVGRVAHETLEWCRKRRAELSNGKLGMWSNISATLIETHENLMMLRARRPHFPGLSHLLGDPRTYLSLIKVLPPAPLFRTAGRVGGLGQKMNNSLAMRNWYFFRHLQEHLLFSNTLDCAVTEKHVCPKAAWRRGKRMLSLDRHPWAPMDSCPFSLFLHAYGIDEIEIDELVS